MEPSVVDHLYDLPAAEFVAARNALAKELRAAGDKALAAEVAKLRRPSGTAWALNQIARRDGALLAAALDAKAALRSATEGTNRGEQVDLRAATAADRTATRAVVAAARTLLGSEDPGLAGRVAGTLLAAVLDQDVEALVRHGRLTAEQDASAFSLAEGELADVIVLADRAPRQKPRPDAAAREAADAERERRRRRADRARVVERLDSRVGRLRAAEAEAEAALRAVTAELTEAVRELDQARAALDDDDA